MFEKAECKFRYGFSLLTVVIYALFYLLSKGLSIYSESLPETVKISASVSHVQVCMTTPRYCYFFLYISHLDSEDISRSSLVSIIE